MDLTREEMVLLKSWKKGFNESTKENVLSGMLFWASGIEQTTKQYPYIHIPASRTIHFKENDSVTVSATVNGKLVGYVDFSTREEFLEWDLDHTLEIFITKDMRVISLGAGKVLERETISYSLVVSVQDYGEKPILTKYRSRTIVSANSLVDLYVTFKSI